MKALASQPRRRFVLLIPGFRLTGNGGWLPSTLLALNSRFVLRIGDTFQIPGKLPLVPVLAITDYVNYGSWDNTG